VQLRGREGRRDFESTLMNRSIPLFGAMLLNLALGAFYAWSVFVLPLEKEFGWSRTSTSSVFTIAIVITIASFAIAGRIQDTRGPRVCAAIGATLLGLGFFLTSYTTSLLYLRGAYGIVVGLGNGIGYAASVPVVSKWFPDRRGLAVGLTVGAYGAGSAIIGPVASHLMESIGWRPTFRLLGVAFSVVGTTGAWLLKNPPKGYRPAGWRLPTIAGGATSPSEVPTREMLRTTTFYALWVAYCLGATAGMMTISQLVPFARSAGLGAATATFALTVGAIGNAGGRIFSGWLSDKLGRLATLRVMVVGSALAMPALFAWRTEVVPFYLLVAAVYWCYGTLLSVFASTCADFYGTRYLGLNYGVLFTGLGTAGVVGPFIGARAFDAFGDYRVAFYAASLLALIAFGALWFARPPSRTVQDLGPAVQV
jgi:OFA family oxalate/formate antiporter-like MFS transporter